MSASAPARSPSLHDLGAPVTVQYPDRPDLALIAALRLLSIVGAAPGVSVAYAQGALVTRRARNTQRTLIVTLPDQQADPEAGPRDGVLIVGSPDPVVLIVGPGSLLDVTSTYRLAELDLPARLLCGGHGTSASSSQHTVVNFPYGLTGVYRIKRVDSPL